MRNINAEISREEFERYNAMPLAEFKKEIANSMPMSITCGYGYYGCTPPFERDGKFFYTYFIGSSCD